MKSFRITFLSLCAAVSLVSCSKETFEKELRADEVIVVASMDPTKASFDEDGITHNLKGSWEPGDVIFGFLENGSKIAFSVSSVDDGTGIATLSQTNSTPLSIGDRVYGIFLPGKTEADLVGSTLPVDFSSQSKDVIPTLMLAEAVVTEERTLTLTFRNAVSVIGIVNPEVATIASRGVTKAIVSGQKIVCSGVVRVVDGNLTLVPDLPSNFITKEVDLTIADGGIESTIYVVIPPCEVGKITMEAGAFFYSWDVNRAVGVSKYCRADGKDFKPLDGVPVSSGVEVGPTEWAIENFNLLHCDDRGDCVKWGDGKLIYSSKTLSSSDFVPLSGFESGFVNQNGEAYFNGSSFDKYNAEDGKTVLEPVDDIVQLNYPGTGWRTPTTEEWEALIADSKTIKSYASLAATFSTENGCSFEITRSFKGANGLALNQGAKYWTASLCSTDPTKAVYYQISSTSRPSLKNGARNLGFAIHPVRTVKGRPGVYPNSPTPMNYNAGKSILSFPEWTDISINYTNLTASNHPRLLLNQNDFNGIVNAIENGTNPYLSKMHKVVVAAAESMAKESNFNKPIEYELDASETRLLMVSRNALRKIWTLAYAYRCTENPRFLRMAEFHIRTVCEFADWHPSHFLDVAEMAAGVALGYDWLYNELSDEVRTLAADRLKRYAVGEALGWKIYNRAGNWNQVCGGGIILAALADYENCPSESDEIIRRFLATNSREIKNIYAPRGAFPEGPGYWEYGTTYQGIMNMALESALGTDFDLPKVEGFPYAGIYYNFVRDNCGSRFNYSDSGDKDEASYGMWYMAYVLKDPSYLYHDLYALDSDYYAKEDYSFLPIACAYRMGAVTATPPSGRIYESKGSNPILVCRTGWDRGDLYLGLKGGSPAQSHAHLDIGEVVFEAYGTRWFKDPKYTTNYEAVENLWKAMGLGPDEPTGWQPNSWRWKLFQYHNRQHSTLTLNDHNQFPYGMGNIYEVFDEPGKMGGSVDLTSAYSTDIKSASRTALIKDESYLEIGDYIETNNDGRSVHVRFTCMTDAVPTVISDGILLSNGTVTMKLSTTAPNPVFKTWSSDPADYPSEIIGRQEPLTGYICGFEYDIPAGQITGVITTLVKQ